MRTDEASTLVILKPDTKNRITERQDIIMWIYSLLTLIILYGCMPTFAQLVVSEHEQVEKYVEGLSSDEWSIRMDGARALGSFNDSLAVSALRNALEDNNEWIRYEAAASLRKLGDTASFERIAQVYLKRLQNSYAGERVRAVENLCDFDDSLSLCALRVALKDSSLAVRCSAAECLGSRGDKSSFDKILQISLRPIVDCTHELGLALAQLAPEDHSALFSLLDGGYQSREIAIVALTELGDTLAVPYLIRVLNREDIGDATTEHVLNALSACSTVAAQAEIDKYARDVTTFGLVAPIYGRAKDSTKVQLLESMFDNDPCAAAAALSSIGSQDAILFLKNECMEYPLACVRGEALAELTAQGQLSEMELVDAMCDWENGTLALEALLKLNWHPRNLADTIYVTILRRKITSETSEEITNFYDEIEARQFVANHHEEMKQLLMVDLTSMKVRRVAFAVNSLVCMGSEDAIPRMIEILDAQDHMWFAEIYLNSNESQLENAAKRWAYRRGCQIYEHPGGTPTQWQRWR